MEDQKRTNGFVIRCGTPDCEWGFSMSDLGELAVEACYSGFRKHCVQVHGLNEYDPDSQVFLDLGKWTLTLLKA